MYLFLLQEGGMDYMEMWNKMGWTARGVVFILAIMSIWSIAVMLERYFTFRAAKKQSREFAPAVAEALKDGKIEEAIMVSERYTKSHLAKVVVAGLKEFQAHTASSELPGELIEASKRALERAAAINREELKRGTGALATIGATAPFVGLFGTTIGIINAFAGMSKGEDTGIGAVAGGISEALVTTAFGLFVAVPAVWLFNYFTTRIEAFTVEMDNSSSELIDYFIKRRSVSRGNL
ncbi:MAG TPA: MotA/TolQ/ExbB proton channel family protein [Acidobacteriota bacterium]|nr:MotA/TolQ/ExbB proton channel family protein [Acidobacteriota bacterium]